MAADDRQRRLELVRGVVREAPLGRERPFEPVEHLVERRRELRDLVLPFRRDARAEVGLRDRARGPCQRGHGPDHAVGEAPGEERSEQEHAEPDGAGAKTPDRSTSFRDLSRKIAATKRLRSPRPP